MFEGQPQHANRLVLQHPERLGNFLHEPVHLVGIDALHFLEQAEIVAQLLGNLDESAQILGKTTAAEAQRGIQEPPPDAVIHAHAVGHFLHVGARRLANHRNRIDVGNLEREK